MGLQKSQGQSISQSQLHGGRGRGSTTDRAGFFHIRKLQYMIGIFSQRAAGVLCDGDEGQAMACRKRDDIRQLGRLAGIGEGKDCIPLS